VYMQYLKPSYPYLFSLAVRTNPFKQDSSAVVSG
jgi:voltage-gated potassium channel